MQGQQNDITRVLNKTQLTQLFNKIFEIEANTLCFECGKKSKQWAEKNHAIFLCLNCAALYKEVPWAIEVKSITLDLWTKQQLNNLARGGNQRFQKYLQFYELNHVSHTEKLKTKAAQHYRVTLQEQAKGHEAPQRIPLQQGKQPFQHQVPITEMNMDEILNVTKQKALWAVDRTSYYGGKAFDKTKYYGGKAIDKVHQKITTGELKKDVKQAGSKIKKGAFNLWGALVTKFDQVTSNQPKQQGQKLNDHKQPQL